MKERDANPHFKNYNVKGVLVNLRLPKDMLKVLLKREMRKLRKDFDKSLLNRIIDLEKRVKELELR